MEGFHPPRLIWPGIRPCRGEHVGEPSRQPRSKVQYPLDDSRCISISIIHVAAALATKFRQCFSVFPVSVSAGITLALSVWAGDLAGRLAFGRGLVGDEFIKLIEIPHPAKPVESRLGVGVGHPLCT